MAETTLLSWREALRACLRKDDNASLAQYVAELPESERSMLLDGIDSDRLRAQVHSLLRREEQLALI